MKPSIFFAALVATITAIGASTANDIQYSFSDGCSAGCADCCACSESRWTIQADAMILDRVMNPTNLIGVYDGNVFVTGRDFDFLPATGPRVAGVYEWNSSWAGEFNYMGVHGWNAKIQNTGGLAFAGPSSISVGNTKGGWDYTSRFDSVELNLRWRTSPTWTWIGGFRYLELAEALHGEMSPPFDVYDYIARVNNQLYGGQIGADFAAWDQGGAVSLHIVGKAGAFSNRCFTRDDYFVLSNGERGSHTAFVGDLAAVGRFALSETWSLRGGYQLLWLGNVGVVPDQLQNAAVTGGPNLSGGLLMHGAIVGIEAQW